MNSIFYPAGRCPGSNLASHLSLQAIAQSLASPVDVRFGHRVTAIEWGSGGVSISCSNGLELEADAVLVTTSVGVLQVRGGKTSVCGLKKVYWGLFIDLGRVKYGPPPPLTSNF